MLLDRDRDEEIMLLEKDRKILKQKLSLIELEMCLNCPSTLIAQDMIELLAHYEKYRLKTKNKRKVEIDYEEFE